MNRFKIISLVVALLMAQLSYAGHYHSVDEQHTETECFLCVHASQLDNAVANDYLIVTNCLLSHSPIVADRQAIQFSQHILFDPRAPPLFS